MNILEILDKKRLNLPLTEEEIKFFVQGYVDDSIYDYQASAMTMAICINGLNEKETFYLTDAMIKSGDTVDLKDITGIKVDKHSTGGVSDTTSIALVPLLACMGLKVAKMSGRGLGFTGGTIDKLMVFDGIQLEQPISNISKIVNKVGCAILAQTANLVPADKKLYALRDVTSTVTSIPLIASSVMSKKIASGNDIIVLDIKIGNGAFMKTLKDAKHLAQLCTKIGKYYNKKVSAIISNMEQPLGTTVGCELETKEAIEVLQGKKGNLHDMVYALFNEILTLADMKCDTKKEFEHLISSGAGLQKLKEMVQELGGDTAFFDKTLTPTNYYKAKKSGYLYDIKTQDLGMLVGDLGGTRKNINDTINLSVGIRLMKNLGDYIQEGDIIAELYDINDSQLSLVNKKLDKILILSNKKPKKQTLVLDKIN